MNARRQAGSLTASLSEASQASTQMGVGPQQKGAMNKRLSAGEATLWPTVGFGDVPFPILWSS